MLKRTILAIGLFFLLSTQLVFAQELVEVKIYRDQLTELHAKVRAITPRIEQQVRKGAIDQATFDLRKEIFSLQKLSQGISEEAQRANLKRQESWQDVSKDLILITQASELLNFVLNALDSYVSTRDKIFLGIAKDSEKLQESIERLI
ncbi:hypothetical protein [Methylomonas koyamae]|uniref:hypothetical protein n=1 Tax=Methylomonas koyamae TaxID=702114 RepID=UPI0006D0E42D|nr:hypothetical protein [Methylomonas koyamae]BBL57977.1 hypothetical protein MKFW12EY_15900 [Methylomonas koyamae]